MDLFVNILEAFGALVALVFGTYGVFVETTFEKTERTPGKATRHISKLNRNGKVILAGVFIGGMISLITKIVSGVNSFEASQKQIEQQKHINDSLAEANRREQQFKYQVDTSLRSTLGALSNLSKKTDGITDRQEENLALQQVQLFNTQKILSPVNPLTFSFLYSAPATHPAVQKYYERMLSLKKRLENRESIEREGLIVSTQRDGHVKAIQVRDAMSDFFPNRDDDLRLGIAFDAGGEAFQVTEGRLNIIGLTVTPGFEISVPTAINDSVHHVGYVITLNFSRSQKPEDDTINVQLTCDINDNSLIQTNPNAPSFNSIFDLQDKYVSVYGNLTTLFNLERVVLISGPDKRITTLPFKDKNRFVEEYWGRRVYYQQKVSRSIFL